MTRVRNTGGAFAGKLALAVGYLSLAAGLVVAWDAPASSYEVSIYAATPLEFWVALAIATAAAVGVSLRDDGQLPLALLLGGISALAVAGLPTIRGYHFYGRADSLVHLGWTRAINVGNDPLALFYPGSHLLSVSLSKVGGIEITRAMMFVMLLYILLFFICVPLCVWFIFPDRRAFAIGAFSGFLLLPINNVSTHLHFHTYSMTMLFVPFVLYVAFTHLLDDESRAAIGARLSDGGRTAGARASAHRESVGLKLGSIEAVPTTYLLPLLSLALVLFHPQVALNVLILLGSIAVVQLWYRRYRPGKSLAAHRALVLQAAVLLVIFVAWVQTHNGAFVRTADTMVESVMGFIEGTAGTTPRIESQAESAETIGVSIWEMFAKLFGIEAVYALLASGVVLAVATGRLDRLKQAKPMQSMPDVGSDVLTLLFFGVLALLPFFALHFVGSISTYLFRHVGFSMMLGTILGAVGIRYTLAALPVRFTELIRRGRPIVVVVVVLVIAVSAASIFPSPSVYLPGSHVPEAEMDGYASSFASQPADSGVWFGGVRTSSERYEQALYGAESAPWAEQVVPEPRDSGAVPETAMLDGLPAYYATLPDPDQRRDHYFVVSAADRGREISAYDSLRYSEAAFEAVDAQPHVGRIRDNGEVTVYYVDVSGASADRPAGENDTDGTADAAGEASE
ncbi:hypothetical protein [Halobellus ordinarius]|uniref:hypothetical protein n=1 Tax=Halobellus ordinarius TaxID=3075120 RepID=UPI00288056D8|nr:hypothetical protein [Halobellus sp. ZY16]